MPPGNSDAPPLLSREARKHLLLVACTIDRLDLVTRCQRPSPVAGIMDQLTNHPWFEMIASLASRWLPRKLRVLHWAWRTWQRTQQAR